MQLVVRDAAVSDAGAAEVWEQLQAERLTGMTMFAEHLDAGGHLRAGVSADEARDVLWAHNSVELWDLLVNQRGWTTSASGAGSAGSWSRRCSDLAALIGRSVRAQ